MKKKRRPAEPHHQITHKDSRSCDLLASDKLVYGYIKSQWNINEAKRGSRSCNTCNKVIATETGLSEATIERGLSRLKAAAKIETRAFRKRVHTGRGPRSKELYRIIFPPRRPKQKDSNMPAKPLPARSDGKSSPQITRIPIVDSNEAALPDWARHRGKLQGHAKK